MAYAVDVPYREAAYDPAAANEFFRKRASPLGYRIACCCLPLLLLLPLLPLPLLPLLLLPLLPLLPLPLLLPLLLPAASPSSCCRSFTAAPPAPAALPCICC